MLHLLVVGRRDDQALVDERGEPLRADVLDVALAAVQRLDDVRLHVDEQHAAAGLAEGRRERDADVAGADHGEVVVGLPRTRRSSVQGGRDAFRGVAVAVERRRIGGKPRGGERRRRASPGSASTFAPASTVSTHSVLGRSVTHGTPQPVRLLLQAARVGDDRLGAGDERQHLEVAERLDRSTFAASAMPCSSSTRRVRGCTGKTKCRPSALIASTISAQPRRARCSPRGGSSGRCTASRSGTSCRCAIGAKTRVASAITSPTTSRRPGTPSLSSWCAERSSGQNSSAESRSTSIRFRSSGIVRSKLRRPASTCATGTSSPAACAPASVVFVSPSTTTQSGRSRSITSRIARRHRSRVSGAQVEPVLRLRQRARRRTPATSTRPSAGRCAARPRRSLRRERRARAAPT